MTASNAILFGPKRQARSRLHLTQCAEVRVAHFDTSGLEDAAAELVTQNIDVVRVGYSDLGVNRARVEALREALRRDGVVE